MHLVKEREEIEGMIRALDKTLSALPIKCFCNKVERNHNYILFSYESDVHILAELTILHLSEKRL